ncbi:MAG TPA: hypothetical protein DDW52_24465 [Planctomycetaceae bacterium]|nr:hypothetical protein [Planctomycetaceae bacterium]
MRTFIFSIAFGLICNFAQADLIGLDDKASPQTESVMTQLEAARLALASSNLEDCRTKLQEIAESQPDLPHPEIILSNWLLEGGYPDKARQLMEQLSVDAPTRMDVHLWYAKLAVSEGRLFDAASHLQLIQHQQPLETWSKAYRRSFLARVQKLRAQVAAMRGEWNSASTILNALIEEGFDDADVRLSLARALFAQKEWTGAEKQLRMAADLASKRVIPELILAELHDGIGNYREAEQWFRESLKRNDDSEVLESKTHRATGAYAAWLLRNNRPDDTLRTIENLSGAKADPAFRMLRAFALQMNGDYESSTVILADLSQSDPGNILIANRLALSLVESEDEGKRGRALQIAEANTKLAPKSVNVACSLAWVQFRLGDLSAASRTAASVLKAGGHLERDSAFFLAQILNALGRSEQAAKLISLAAKGTGEFYNLRRLKKRNTPEGTS